MSATPAPLARLQKNGTKVGEYRLANGMTVLLVERHADPVVAVMIWYKVGARNEREHEAGVSHFLEHMMFKGSPRFAKGEIDRLTTTLGGSNNAFTSSDHTAYWFELASDRWEKALEIEADRMRAVLLDAKEFDRERAVVLEELAMGLDEPWRRLADLVQGTLFLRHPYRRPVIGHADALKRMSVADMRDYHRRFYHPGNATLVICGDIDPADALAKARAHFEPIPAGIPYVEADPFRPAEEPGSGERRVQVKWDDEGKRLCMAWPTAKVGSDDDAALDVLSTLLTGGRLSRLHRRLVVETELASSVSSHNDARVEGGVFWIFAECAQGASQERLEKEIDRELARVIENKIPSRELARVRSLLEAAEAYDHETTSDIAEQIGEAAVDAHWKLAFESLGNALSVDAARLRDCARRLLGHERRVVGWCLPAKAPAAHKPARGGARR
ncbi:MAG: insulinase family protein [Planctomycetes bacterium]|nr:insulinase family protein [Planctomycetota bacterium]